MNLAARARRAAKKLGLRAPGSDRRPTAWRPAIPPPHAGQRQVLDNCARFNVVNCGRRWGKSLMGQWLICEPALDGYPVGVFAPDYKALMEVWRDLCRHLRAVTVKRDAQQFRLELSTGGVIDFWSLDSDPEACRGRRYRRVVLDEAAKARHLKLAWEMAISPTLIDFAGDAWFLSTPRGRDYYWELWWQGHADNEDRKRSWASFQMPTWTNPFLPAEEIERIKTETPADVLSQEYEAQFLEVGGRFFSEWDETRHVCNPFDIPEHYRWIGGLDFGTSIEAATAFLLGAIDEDNRLLVVDEVYVNNMVASEQAKLVAQCMIRNGIPRERFGEVLVATDTSIFPPQDARQRLGEYEVEAFWREGIECVPAVKARITGWNRLKEMIHQDKVTVFRGRCANLIRTVPLMIRDEKKSMDMDTTLEDHACDAWRYMAMVRTEASQEKIKRDMPKYARLTEEYLQRARSSQDKL